MLDHCTEKHLEGIGSKRSLFLLREELGPCSGLTSIPTAVGCLLG